MIIVKILFLFIFISSSYSWVDAEYGVDNSSVKIEISNEEGDADHLYEMINIEEKINTFNVSVKKLTALTRRKRQLFDLACVKDFKVDESFCILVLNKTKNSFVDKREGRASFLWEKKNRKQRDFAQYFHAEEKKALKTEVFKSSDSKLRIFKTEKSDHHGPTLGILYTNLE